MSYIKYEKVELSKRRNPFLYTILVVVVYNPCSYTIFTNTHSIVPALAYPCEVVRAAVYLFQREKSC